MTVSKLKQLYKIDDCQWLGKIVNTNYPVSMITAILERSI